MCQEPSCGGLAKYPNRPFENGLNATTGLFSFASSPFINYLGLECPAHECNLSKRNPRTLLSGSDPGKLRFPAGCDHRALRPKQQESLRDSDQCFPRVPTLQGHDIKHLGNLSARCASGQLLQREPARSERHRAGPRFKRRCQLQEPLFRFRFAAQSGRSNRASELHAVPAQMVIPDVPHINGVPGFRDPQYSVFFEATSRWDSVYNGLLVNLSKRLTHNFSYQISYTYSHSIDDGPNPSFVLIPQDSANFDAERASSADDARHRFVANAIFTSPETWNVVLRNFSFSTIVTLQSPQYFTKYAGFDANGDVFGNNDRVGGEPRNTFKGDSLQTVDVRLERTFPIRERMKLQLMVEAFNLDEHRERPLFQHQLRRGGLLSRRSGRPGLCRSHAVLPRGFAEPALRNAKRGIQPAPAPVGGTDYLVDSEQWSELPSRAWKGIQPRKRS